MASLPEHDEAHAGARLLIDLPPEMISRITLLLGGARDLAAANATARIFRGAPSERSPIEYALRERARARGHDCALPPTLPVGVSTWTEELFAREHVLELALAHVDVVAAGGQDEENCFSAFVDAEGGLHTCGEEVVTDEATGAPTGEYRSHVATSCPGMQAVRVPTRVASLSAVRVVAVAAGWAHLLALSDAGSVYGCGDNGFGQLGTGDTDERQSFAPVTHLRGAAVVSISAGFKHSLALTAAGCAYSWGFNWCGQLGHGDTKDRCEPTRIEALDGVRVGGLFAGQQHTLLLSSRGDVYSCGHGHGDQLGHGDGRAQRTPRRIEALAGVRAVHMSAGPNHSLVVDAAGGVHSFGSGNSGELGHGDYATQLVPTPVVALAGVRAVRASGAVFGSAVVCADGSVHTFGKNGDGQLGFDTTTLSASPLQVGTLAHARVLQCSLCATHSLFVTADGAAYACGKQSAALGLGVHDPGAIQPAPQRVVQLPPLSAALH